MKWVTRARPKTDRIACPWLIKKFIDPEAEILYVDPERVLEVAKREEAHSFDAPEARYTHRARRRYRRRRRHHASVCRVEGHSRRVFSRRTRRPAAPADRDAHLRRPLRVV